MKEIINKKEITEKKDISKKLYWSILFLLCALPLLINLAAVFPPILALSANVAYSDWAEVLSYISDFLNLFAFCAPYALLIFSRRFLSNSHTRLVLIFYFTAIILNVPLKLLMYAPVFGSLGDIANISYNLLTLLIECATSAIQMILVFFIAAAPKKNNDEPLPFKSLFSFKNSLQLSAFKMSSIIFAIRLISKSFSLIMNIIQYGAEGFFADFLWQVLYFSVDVLTYAVYGTVGYFLALLLFVFLYDKLKTTDIFKTEKVKKQPKTKKKSKKEKADTFSSLDI